MCLLINDNIVYAEDADISYPFYINCIDKSRNKLQNKTKQTIINDGTNNINKNVYFILFVRKFSFFIFIFS